MAKTQNTAWLNATALHAYQDHSQVGIHHSRRPLGELGDGGVIETLTFRDAGGVLLGLLTFYDGHIHVLVHPGHLRQKVGTALVTEATRRWEVDLEAQSLTPVSIPFVAHLIDLGLI